MGNHWATTTVTLRTSDKREDNTDKSSFVNARILEKRNMSGANTWYLHIAKQVFDDIITELHTLGGELQVVQDLTLIMQLSDSLPLWTSGWAHGPPGTSATVLRLQYSAHLPVPPGPPNTLPPALPTVQRHPLYFPQVFIGLFFSPSIPWRHFECPIYSGASRIVRYEPNQIG
ncbi:hypothetical protein DFH29DRAFT_871195 [Suillus ampliporus]|nr:hypothetical protein DFH29DRAFT_871195 [Suillus ampliporus]